MVQTAETSGGWASKNSLTEIADQYSLLIAQENEEIYVTADFSQSPAGNKAVDTASVYPPQVELSSHSVLKSRSHQQAT